MAEYDNGYNMIPDLSSSGEAPGDGPGPIATAGIVLLFPLAFAIAPFIGIWWWLCHVGLNYKIAVLLTLAIVAFPIWLYRRLARPAVRP